MPFDYAILLVCVDTYDVWIKIGEDIFETHKFCTFKEVVQEMLNFNCLMRQYNMKKIFSEDEDNVLRVGYKKRA